MSTAGRTKHKPNHKCINCGKGKQYIKDEIDKLLKFLQVVSIHIT